MSTKVHIVRTKGDLKEFIHLPAKIHKGHPNWVPPVYADEWNFYNPASNNALKYCDTVLLLAKTDGVVTGRIMGIINKKYNEAHNEFAGRFFNIECYDDVEVVRLLLNAVEEWALAKGMKKIIGPFGFSDRDPQGLQIEGFEYIPVIATPCNLPYMQKLVEQQGYEKMFDCLSYELIIPDTIPETYQRIYNYALERYKYRIVEFNSKKELKPYIIPVLQLMNETYHAIYGFLPLEREEMEQLAKRYLFMLDEEFIKIVLDDDKPIAFVVASPDMSRGLIKAKGHLFPFGIFYILRSAAKSSQLDLFLGGVKPGYHTGVTALLGVSLLASAKRRRMRVIDSHLILESNHSMRNIMERLGARIYKRYRIYKKDLVLSY